MKPKTISFNLSKYKTYEPIPATGTEVFIANIPYRRCVVHNFVNEDFTFDPALWVVSDWATGMGLSEACKTKAAAVKSAFERCEKNMQYLPEVFYRCPVLNHGEHVVSLPATLSPSQVVSIAINANELNTESVKEMLKLLKPIDKR
jgi:hypothetical protein